MLKKSYLTITECSKTTGLCRQAVYLAVKKGRLPYQIIRNKFVVDPHDLLNYISSRYSRRKSIYEGKPLYADDEISPKEISNLYELDLNFVYSLLRTGILKYYRKNWSYIIKKEDVDNYIQSKKMDKRKCV